MPSYAGVTFGIRINSNQYPAAFEREGQVVVTHIPGSDESDVQWLGLANGKLTVPASLDTYANYLTLKAAVGITKRTLIYNGGDQYNVMLLAVRNVVQIPGKPYVWCDLDFMQGSS